MESYEDFEKKEVAERREALWLKIHELEKRVNGYERNSHLLMAEIESLRVENNQLKTIISLHGTLADANRDLANSNRELAASNRNLSNSIVDSAQTVEDETTIQLKLVE